MVTRKPYHAALYRLTRPKVRYAAALTLAGLLVAILSWQTPGPASLIVSSGNAPAISAPLPLPVVLPATDDSSALPNLLSKDDAALYQAIFRAQKKSDWETADAAIAQLNNPVLLGHVLAARYLDRHYATKPAELADWLSHYADHPQAADIHDLAVAKTPALKNQLPQLPAQAALSGYGDDNGLAQGDDAVYTRRWNMALNAWRLGHKTEAAKLFSGILRHSDSLAPWNASAAAYWAYRSYQAVGNRRQADLYLHIAANEPRSFYGILALRKLKQPLALDKTSIDLSDSDLLEIIGDPVVKRTMALAQIDENDLAEQELRSRFPQADTVEKFRLLALAHSLNLASVQIGMARQLSHDGQQFDFARYPIPDWRPQGGFKVDPALMLALMRQESGFHASAVSSGGALGLMQLMPQTALLMQKDMSRTGNISEPVMNMTLGQNYIRNLLDSDAVNGNLFYLLAAYNAGPGRLQEWKDSIGNSHDPLLFVESIPYAQTRHYVMQVMTNYWIYSELTGSANYSVYALLNNRMPAYDAYIAPLASAN